MNAIQSFRPVSSLTTQANLPSGPKVRDRAAEKAEFQQKFDEVLGMTMYGMMLKSLRQSSHKTPYFNGGRTEEVFGQQLDQVLSEKMGRRDAERHTNHVASLNSLARK